MKLYIKVLALWVILMGGSRGCLAQCFPGQPVTAAYADPTTSASEHADKVLWLTWGANLQESKTSHPYGKPDVRLNVGTKSYGSINLGNGIYMCIEAEIMEIDMFGGVAPRAGIASYIPGTFTGDNINEGDFLDILYNIGGGRGPGNVSQNIMASGIINQKNGRGARVKLKLKAKIDGRSVRLPGMVLADAESLGSTEHIYATGVGHWSIVEVQKNLNRGPYYISKETNVYSGGTSSETVLFQSGNDRRTGAVAFLSFRPEAYNVSDELSVTFSAEFKGGGSTAMAIGVLTPKVDFGDAPLSYGFPVHLIRNLAFTNDGITPVLSSASQAVKDAARENINRGYYNPGNIESAERRFLGTTAPDADTTPLHSDDALGDDKSGTAGINEEDAWPKMYQRFGDTEHYKPGDKIIADIPYNGGLIGDKISGWIDFDLNGTFDEGERATATISAIGEGSVSLVWTVPPTRKPYSTYVRLRYFDKNEDATRPTGNAIHGEVEDHRIYILSPGVTNPLLMNKSKQP